MPYLGAHMSISGGMEKAFYRGKEAGCEVIQIFTHNTSSWYMKPLSQEQIDAFTKAREETGISPVAVHVGYLINIASPDDKIWKSSVSSLLKEVERAVMLNIPYVVMHPGSHKGAGEAYGIKRISEGLKRVIAETEEARILLETTAGQGTSIGYRFEHLADIIDMTGSRDRLGICLDTCHIFAAGYDFRTKEAYDAVMEKLERSIGLDYLFLFHVNDSKKALGSRVDRHMHIGEGMIGETGFAHLLKDHRFRDHAFIIETPKQKDEKGKDYDIINLERLRNIMRREE